MVDTRPFLSVPIEAAVMHYSAVARLVAPDGDFVGVAVIAFRASALDDSLAAAARAKDAAGTEVFLMEERSPHYLVAASVAGAALNGTERVIAGESQWRRIRERCPTA